MDKRNKPDRKSRYINSPCIKKLLDKGRIPMLFVGSGLSKRYLASYPSWEELIRFVAEQIGVSNNQLIAMKQEITDANPTEEKGKIYAKLGSSLTKIFRDKVIAGNINLENFFSQEEIDRIEKENISFVKMLISKKLSNYEITPNKKYISELNEFKKLQNNIGAIVTTNYDRFLEKEVFNNFDVFVEQSQYYMTECAGIGEVYKIHGSVESPNSIIFTEEDYDNFEENLRVIAAKILNLALEYPIVFIGYSLEDDDVLSILYTLVNALTKTQLDELSKNLIYVEWKKGEENLLESKEVINKNGKTLEFTRIITDNYFVLYKHLGKFTPYERPERVRKYKKMIQKLIIDSNKGEATIIANENLDKLKNDGKLVIAFGETESFAEMGIVGFTTDHLIKLVLKQEKNISKTLADKIFEKFYLSSRIANNHFVPMFYITKISDTHKDNSKLLMMKENLLSWINSVNQDKGIKLYPNYDSIKNNPDELADYKYILCIVKTYDNNKISYFECLNLLVDLEAQESTIIKKTEFRKAVAYLDLK